MTSDASQSLRLWLCCAAFALTLLFPLCFRSLQAIPPSALQLAPRRQRFLDHFVAAAVERTHHTVRYDPAYVRIPYPGGDVPASTGVCTDEIIRAYRAVGIDLQKEVHEDMANHLQRIRGSGAVHPARRSQPLTPTSTTAAYQISWFFQPPRAETFSLGGRAGLWSGRSCNLEFRRRDHTHWNCRGPEIAAVRPLPHRSQHRPGPSDGGRSLQLENHRPLPLLGKHSIVSSRFNFLQNNS